MNERESSDRFGYEWHNYPEIFPDYEKQFLRWTAPLGPEDWRGKSFLDAGCGMGRNSFWPMRYGAVSGTAIDLDQRSLVVPKRSLSAFPSMRIERVSVYDLPYRDAFDIAFSIGVVHHLEDPERALRAITNAVKPGGKVLIWVYGRENNEWIVTYLDPLRIALFSRLPIGLVHVLSWGPAAALWVILRMGLIRIEYFRMIRHFRFRHLRAMVFDQMLPLIANYWPRATVQAMMENAGLRDVTLTWINGVSWSAVGTRPS